MSAPSYVGEPGARRVSPFLFILVILCFFLAFAGVSCNTDKAKSAVAQFGGLSGANPGQLAQVNNCIDALGGVSIASYTGFNLVFGQNPTINTSSEPAACNQSGTPVTSTATDASQGNIGPQPLALIAFICIVFAALLGLLGFFGVVIGRARALTSAVLAAAAALLIILDHLHVHDAVINKLMSAAGASAASIPGFSLGDYLNVGFGIGLLLAIVGLVVVALYNVAALMIPSSLPPPPDPPPIPSG